MTDQRHREWPGALNARERTWPVGGKKPNDLGSFDMHGNIDTWCQDSGAAYEAFEDKEDVLDKITDGRLLRGSSFISLPSFVRSAYRNGNVPGDCISRVGFRLARTLTFR